MPAPDTVVNYYRLYNRTTAVRMGCLVKSVSFIQTRERIFKWVIVGRVGWSFTVDLNKDELLFG